MSTLLLQVAFIAATFAYAFLYGMNDSGGFVATAISSRSSSSRFALTPASTAEFPGPFLFGTAVARTIGKDLIQFSTVTVQALLIGISSATVWSIVTRYSGLRSSSTHALLGGLIGAASIQCAPAPIGKGFVQVLALFLAPIFDFIAGFKLSTLLTQNGSPRIKRCFKRAQILNVIALALSHGTNDQQKSMGLITLALASQKQNEFPIPLRVTLR